MECIFLLSWGAAGTVGHLCSNRELFVLVLADMQGASAGGALLAPGDSGVWLGCGAGSSIAAGCESLGRLAGKQCHVKPVAATFFGESALLCRIVLKGVIRGMTRNITSAGGRYSRSSALEMGMVRWWSLW